MESIKRLRNHFITHYVTELGGVHKTHANVLISPFRIM